MENPYLKSTASYDLMEERVDWVISLNLILDGLAWKQALLRMKERPVAECF